jgi:hypothetical protein
MESSRMPANQHGSRLFAPHLTGFNRRLNFFKGETISVGDD